LGKDLIEEEDVCVHVGYRRIFLRRGIATIWDKGAVWMFKRRN